MIFLCKFGHLDRAMPYLYGWFLRFVAIFSIFEKNIIPKTYFFNSKSIIMKKIISFFTFSFLFLTHLTAQTTVTEGGIQFLHDDWKTAIRLSKSMNKPIFLDAHTNWCAPCKLMSRTTFVDKNVVQFFNEKFINL